jgi:hypothetical protein
LASVQLVEQEVPPLALATVVPPQLSGCVGAGTLPQPMPPVPIPPFPPVETVPPSPPVATVPPCPPVLLLLLLDAGELVPLLSTSSAQAPNTAASAKLVITPNHSFVISFP